jgi:hypothetical protein
MMLARQEAPLYSAESRERRTCIISIMVSNPTMPPTRQKRMMPKVFIATPFRRKIFVLKLWRSFSPCQSTFELARGRSKKGCSRLGVSLVFFLTYQESPAEKIAEKAQPEQNKDQAAKTVEIGSLGELMALFDKLS